MPAKLKATLVGVVIAIIVGIAASQGLISQQTAEEIKAKTSEILSEEPTTPQQTPAPVETSQPEPAARQAQ